MNKFIPVLSFLLSLLSLSLKYLHLSSQTTVSTLFTIESVDAQLKSEMVKFADGYAFFAFATGLISTVMAAVSIHSKFCNKSIGIILLIISFLSVLFSLLNG